MSARAPVQNVPVQIVYDGECPFCTAYVRLLRLRESYDVELVDARSGHPVVAEIESQGLDLDEGMVVKMHGRLHHGADGVNRLAAMGAKAGPLRAFWNWVFKDSTRARLLYPPLRAGRNLALRLLGRRKINP